MGENTQVRRSIPIDQRNIGKGAGNAATGVARRNWR